MSEIQPCESTPLPPGDNWDQRYPEHKGDSWVATASVLRDTGTCLHQAEDISRIALKLSDYSTGIVYLGVDLETGLMFVESGFNGWGSSFMPAPSKTLPPEAVEELRTILDQVEVVSWPFTEFDVSEHEFHHNFNDDYELALLYKDGTANYQRHWPHNQAKTLLPLLVDFIKTYAPEATDKLTNEW